MKIMMMKIMKNKKLFLDLAKFYLQLGYGSYIYTIRYFVHILVMFVSLVFILIKVKHLANFQL